VAVHSRVEMDISTPLDKTTTLSGVISKNGKPRLYRCENLKFLIQNACSYESQHGIGVPTSVSGPPFIGNEISILHSAP